MQLDVKLAPQRRARYQVLTKGCLQQPFNIVGAPLKIPQVLSHLAGFREGRPQIYLSLHVTVMVQEAPHHYIAPHAQNQEVLHLSKGQEVAFHIHALSSQTWKQWCPIDRKAVPMAADQKTHWTLEAISSVSEVEVGGA